MAITFLLDNTVLTRERKSTYLASDAVAGATNIAVQSIVGFNSTAKFVLIGELGGEKTELVKFSEATLPSGTTIYLLSGLTFDHPQDTKVYEVGWDQFAISRSIGLTSEKGTLATESLQVDQLKSIYRDTVNTEGYGFFQFKRSTTPVAFSQCSNSIPYVNFSDKTVMSIKKRALSEVGEEISEIITNKFLDEKLWEARREYHNAPGKRPFRKKYNTDIGNVSTGMYRVLAPTDLEDPATAENLYGVRIGVESNMRYMDKKEFDQAYRNVARTELSTAYTVGDLDLYCSDVRDLDDSGTVHLEDDSIQYSAKGVAGGTLRISADGEDNHDNETNVWQNESMGLPSRFTVFNSSGSAYIYFNCPISADYVNQNIWADYYRTLVEKTDDSDELDETNYDMYVHYLAYQIKKRKEKGILPLTDEDYIRWIDMKKTSLKAEYIGDKIRISPGVGHLPLAN